MKCVVKAKCQKEEFLDHTLLSIEQKYKNGYTYGWYITRLDAQKDIQSLEQSSIKAECLHGWEVEGFVTLKYK